MAIVEVDPQTDPRWQVLVERYHSSAFHSPAWIRVLADTYDLEVRALVELAEHDEPRAGVVFARIKDMLGERNVILPFSDYCDPLVRSAQEWACLSDRLLVEPCTITMRCLHNDLPLGDTRFTQVKRAKWHALDLLPELESVWGGLDESSKRAIRKAQRDGVTTFIAQDEDALRAFFEMHLRVRKYKYRLLSQPYRFFENIWRCLVDQNQGFLMLASHQNDIIGGIFFLEWQDKLYYKFNASSLTGLRHRPNDLLIWEGIKYAKARDYVQLDFGLSDWDQDGLIRYKRKFATEEKTITYLRAAAADEEENPARQLLPQLTDLLTEDGVPDAVTERAGDLLYRFFV